MELLEWLDSLPSNLLAPLSLTLTVSISVLA